MIHTLRQLQLLARIVAFGTLLVGCKAKTHDTVSESDWYAATCGAKGCGRTKGDLRWQSLLNGKPLPVCFEPTSNLEDPQGHAEAFMATITEGYTQTLGFEFDWIGLCPPPSTALRQKYPELLRVALDSTLSARVQDLGVMLNHMPKGLYMNIPKGNAPYCNTPDRYRMCFAVFSLHEMGHVLGLLHEMNRPDAVCARSDGSGRGGKGVRGAIGSERADPDSIMSYCSNFRYVSAQIPMMPRLSAGDIEGLSTLYHSTNAPTAVGSTIGSDPDEPPSVEANRYLDDDWNPVRAYLGAVARRYVAPANVDCFVQAISVTAQQLGQLSDDVYRAVAQSCGN